MKSSNRGRGGQSIVEVMMALSFITIGLGGLLALLSRSFFLNRVATDELTATYLASEGIEIVKSLIDNGLFSGAGWSSGLASGDYEVDYATTSTPPHPFPSGGDKLLLDPATHLYGYGFDGSVSGSAIPTNFVRRIRIQSAADQIVVNSIISWDTGPITSQSINLEDHFYRWR